MLMSLAKKTKNKTDFQWGGFPRQEGGAPTMIEQFWTIFLE